MSQLTPRDDEKTTGDDLMPEAKKVEVVEYPSMHKRILIMTALLLAIFLVTLVIIFHSTKKVFAHGLKTNYNVGPKYYIDRNTSNH